VPSPAQPTPANILQAYKDKKINLEALYSGGNPFDGEQGRATELLSDGTEEPAF
jgi:hypothetical protein